MSNLCDLNVEEGVKKRDITNDHFSWKVFYRNKTFEEIFTLSNLYEAGKRCCKGVRWKSSTTTFENFLLSECIKLHQELHDGTYKFRGFEHFLTCEHGKERDINALAIRDRAVQACLYYNLLLPAYSRSFVYDNSASLPDKGMLHSLQRLECALQKHYRKHGTEGGILQYDGKKYFASVRHELLKEKARATFKDKKLLAIIEQLIDDFNTMDTTEKNMLLQMGIIKDMSEEVGIGLGSPISQIFALDYFNSIDHYIKDVLKLPSGRYMDDGWIISSNYEELYEIKDKIVALAAEKGIKINPDKCRITPFKNNNGFVFLKIHFKLLDTGKIKKKISAKGVKAIKRKLDIFRRWVDEGTFTFDAVQKSYQSYRAYCARCDCYKTIEALDKYFVKLYRKELAVRKNRFKCHLYAKKINGKWHYFERNNSGKNNKQQQNKQNNKNK